MPEPSIYDVAIIGAGPAGTSAAYTAASEGLSTLIVEEHAKVGEPVHCGECLSDYALKRMDLELPEEVIARHCPGIKVIFPDGKEITYHEKGYVLDKHLFEQFLAVRAQGAGARLQLGTRVMGMARQGGVWTLSVNKGEPIKARAVIDASGYQSVASQATGLNEKKFSTVGGAQYLMDDLEHDDWIDFFLWPRLAPHGYLWIIPKRGKTANVGLCSSDNANLHKYLKQFIQEKGLGSAKLVRPFGGVIPASGPLPHTYADGLLLAGDAAGFTSPMFEGGTQLGLKSGQMAALTLARAAQSPKPSTPSLENMADADDPSHAASGAARDPSPLAPSPSSHAPASPSGASGGFPADASGPDPFSAHALSEYETAWRAEFPPYEKLVVGKDRMYGFSDEDLTRLGRILPNDLTRLTWVDKARIGAQLLLDQKLWNNGVMAALDTFAYSTGPNYGW